MMRGVLKSKKLNLMISVLYRNEIELKTTSKIRKIQLICSKVLKVCLVRENGYSILISFRHLKLKFIKSVYNCNVKTLKYWYAFNILIDNLYIVMYDLFLVLNLFYYVLKMWSYQFHHIYTFKGMELL